MTYNRIMTYRVLLPDLLNLVLALWFLSIGYLLFRRANRALNGQPCRAPLVLGQRQPELSYLATGSYRISRV